MRARGSVTGPLVLIFIGAIFLAHTFSPNLDLSGFFTHYWPTILIIWGAVQLVEINIRAARGNALPVNGISFGGWVLVIFVCAIGLGLHEVRRPDNWWRRAGFEHSVEMFGEDHDYPINTMRREVGIQPRIVIESFRGNAKIVGQPGETVQLSGHNTIKTWQGQDADAASRRMTVEMLMAGNVVTIRCHQDPGVNHTMASTDLELSVPVGASVEATGRTGDFDVSGLIGNVDITSENAGVRIDDVDGNVKIDTRKGDIVRCRNVKGTVDLRGHGNDVELTKVAGLVTVTGDYGGTMTLHDLAKPIHIQSMQTEMTAQSLPGTLTLERGHVNGNNLVGPVQLTTRATDVDLQDFTAGLSVTVDKGDLELRPGRTPLSKMVVRTRSGNIDLELPKGSEFELKASTTRGEIENEFATSLTARTQGPGARLEGLIGKGPELSVETDVGTITVRKSDGSKVAAKTKGDDEGDSTDSDETDSQDTDKPATKAKRPMKNGEQVEL